MTGPVAEDYSGVQWLSIWQGIPGVQGFGRFVGWGVAVEIQTAVPIAVTHSGKGVDTEAQPFAPAQILAPVSGCVSVHMPQAVFEFCRELGL